jgi:hypothetical protein
MLKIRLTWLQPSLGVLGIALLLSSPFAASAATKPVKTAATKAPKQQPIAIKAGTTIDQELQLSAVSQTPDFAVRQLAISTMANSGTRAPSVATRPAQIDRNSNALASFLSPTEGLQNLSARAISKPQFVKHSVAAAVATASLPAKAGVIVPGLLIGTSDVHLSSQFLPNGRPERPSLTAKFLATPAPTAAMLAAAPIATPFPVVLPQQMPGLSMTPGISTLPKIQITTPANDSIAQIPAGLQRLLGNEIGQPTASIAPVAKAATPKINALVALSQLVSPGTPAPTVTARGASLQLNTAQVYASVQKFDIPGAKISNSPSAREFQAAKPILSVFAAKPVQKDLAIAVTQRKGNYVALMSDRFLTPTPKPAWTTVVSHSNNLGGFILGSQAPAPANVLALIPMTGMTATPKGVIFANPANAN